MTRRWNWREGAHIAIDANLAGRELEDIEKKEGRLTPGLVLERARSDNSVLHAHFEWDDAKAGEKYRLSQAGEIIRSIEIDFTTSNIEPGRRVRAFVHVVQKSGDRAYTPMHTAMSDEELRRQVLRKAWDELLAFRERYKGLSELAAVFAAVDKARAKTAA